MGLNIKELKKYVKLELYKLLGKTYYGQRKKQIVFVLSTGRCGSTSIVKMFNQHPKFSAFHEDIPELIKLSTKLTEEPDSKEEIYKQLDFIFKNKLWFGSSDKIHVHSDHRLWNLVEFLSGYFPNSIFIHLIRNPYDSLKSFVPRNWYPNDFDFYETNNLYEKYRIRGNRLGVFSDKEWQGMTNPEKCAWYWNFVNKNIAAQIEKLNSKKHPSFIIQLEFLTLLMNTYIRELFGLEDNFFFKNVVSNATKSEKRISELSPDFERAIQEFAIDRNSFYPEDKTLNKKQR